MIRTRTLFILGAGASIPYGFPSGATLREWLCDITRRDSAQHVINALGVTREEIGRFAGAFKSSGQLSIDSFLARRPDFKDIGKFCIAAELCRCEEPSAVKRLNNDDHWYTLLWEALQRDAQSVKDIPLNAVKIVTFNYDRSLEYFLFEAMRNTFPQVTDDEALEVINSLNILHVYGSLGNFAAGPKADARTYYNPVDPTTLHIAAGGIRVIPEARDNDPIFARAQENVIWSQRICLLGFGFDLLNLARLDIPRALRDRGEANGFVWIVASAIGKTEAELNAYIARIRPNDPRWNTISANNSMTLRQTGILL